MEKSKKNLIVGLILAAMLPIIFLLSACGAEISYVWNKTYKFTGLMDCEWGTAMNHGLQYGDLLKQEYNRNNLDLQNVKIEDRSVDLSFCGSYEELKQNLETLLSQAAIAKINNLTISFKSEEDGLVNIAGTDYRFEKNGNYHSSYKILDEDNVTVGFFFGMVETINNKNVVSVSLYSILNTVYFSIPTKEICYDESAHREEEYDYATGTTTILSTKIVVGARPLYEEVKA